MMYHHHILTAGKNETIMDMYIKQKSDPTKGHWYELFKKKILSISLVFETFLKLIKLQCKSNFNRN